MTSRKIKGLTIICELTQWSLKKLDKDHIHVTGTIKDSKLPQDFRDGDQFTIMNTRLISYLNNRDTEPYYLARSQLGSYFMLKVSEKSDASVV